MCNECFSTPCDRSCPNSSYENEDIKIICEICGDTLEIDEEYIDFDSGPCCFACFKEMDIFAVIEKCEVPRKLVGYE